MEQNRETEKKSLRSGIEKDISIVDRFINDPVTPANVRMSWNEVREVAISFTEMIDGMGIGE